MPIGGVSVVAAVRVIVRPAVGTIHIVSIIAIIAVAVLPEITHQIAIGIIGIHVGVALSIGRVSALTAVHKLELRNLLIAGHPVRGEILYQGAIALCAVFDEQVRTLLEELDVPCRDACAEPDTAVAAVHYLNAHAALENKCARIERGGRRRHGDHLRHGQRRAIGERESRHPRSQRIIGMRDHHLDVLAVCPP